VDGGGVGHVVRVGRRSVLRKRKEEKGRAQRLQMTGEDGISYKH